jgi:hypothetical protein
MVQRERCDQFLAHAIGCTELEFAARLVEHVEAAVRIDHIGLSVFADLDLRDHVPDQLEIDLGDADAGVEPATRSCRARTPSEVNRTATPHQVTPPSR